MKIRIRPVDEGDYAEISEIYATEAVIAETSQIPHRNAAFWKTFYQSKGGNYIELVALADERIAGHLGILMDARPRRRHVASFGLAVHPDFQRRGVGRALVRELVHLADNWLNLLRIELDVYADNAGAIALYEAFGFVVEGESRCDSFKHGRYVNSLRMSRLRPDAEPAS